MFGDDDDFELIQEAFNSRSKVREPKIAAPISDESGPVKSKDAVPQAIKQKTAQANSCLPKGTVETKCIAPHNDEVLDPDMDGAPGNTFDGGPRRKMKVGPLEKARIKKESFYGSTFVEYFEKDYRPENKASGVRNKGTNGEGPIRCGYCSGSGKRGLNPCGHCSGSGKVLMKTSTPLNWEGDLVNGTKSGKNEPLKGDKK
jgi:hypothetical protein